MSAATPAALLGRALTLRAEYTPGGDLPLLWNHCFGSVEGRFGVPKPSWIVRTESNILKLEKRKPIPPCSICNGSGRVDCHKCRGRGRTNCVHLAMLPKGEWPKWCKACGGSGLAYCNRCLGTGEYRDIMGFHFMRSGVNSSSSLQDN